MSALEQGGRAWAWWSLVALRWRLRGVGWCWWGCGWSALVGWGLVVSWLVVGLGVGFGVGLPVGLAWLGCMAWGFSSSLGFGLGCFGLGATGKEPLKLINGSYMAT